MTFKIICQKCNQEGILGETRAGGICIKTDVLTSIEEDVFTIRFDNSGGYNVVEFTCNNCGNEVSACE
jgi:hypothetical protein